MEAPNEGPCEWICISLILNCLQCCDDSHSNERMCDVFVQGGMAALQVSSSIYSSLDRRCTTSGLSHEVHF
jgi:hypothetical protein